MKLNPAESSKINKFDLVAFLLIFFYFLALVLFSYKEGQTLYAKIAAAMIVLYFLMKLVAGKRTRMVFPAEYQFLLGWFTWSILSLLGAINQDIAFNKIITLFQVLSISYAVFNLIIWQKSVTGYWIIIIFAALAASAFVFVNPNSYIGLDGRVHGTVGNANLLAVVLIAGMLASLVYVITLKNIFYRIVAMIIATFLFYMIIETGSRKGMLGGIVLSFVIMSIITLHLYRVSKGKCFLTIIVGLTIVIGASVYILNSQHAHRLTRLSSVIEKGSMSGAAKSESGRVKLYQIAFDVGLKNPVFGIGLDNFREIRSGKTFGSKVGTYAHSNYMEVMVSTGIIGLMIYISIYVSMLFKLFRLRKAIFQKELVGGYALASSLLAMFIILDFAMVSYSEKISCFILAGLIAQISILQKQMELINE